MAADLGWGTNWIRSDPSSDSSSCSYLAVLGTALCAELTTVSAAGVLAGATGAATPVIPLWVGWSLGGLVALAAAARWSGPQRLLLIAASPRFVQAPDWSAALPAAELAAFATALSTDRAGLDRRFSALCAQGGAQPGALRRNLLAARIHYPASLAGLQAGLRALARGDLRSDWARLQIPTAVCLYADDVLVPPAVGADLLRLRPDAKVDIRPGGHASWLEEPAALAAILREMMV